MSRRRVSLSGSSCWYLVEQKPLQVQKERRKRKKEREPHLPQSRIAAPRRTGRRGAAARRAVAGSSSLYSSWGEYIKGPPALTLTNSTGFYSHVIAMSPPPEHTCPQLNRNKTKNTSSRRAGCCCARRGS